MSQSDDAPELGITHEDRVKMGELLARSKEHGQKFYGRGHGLDVDCVNLALDHCPEGFGPAGVLLTAWLFENGSSTATEAADATGITYRTAKPTFDALVEAGLAHTKSQRTFEGPGRNPTVYVPAPDLD